MAETRVHARNDYFGTEAERDALSLPSDAIGTRFYATDTEAFAVWSGSSWIEAGGSGGGGGGDFFFHIEGALAAASGVGPNIIVPRTCTITEVVIYVETTGSAGSTVLDVNLNGTTIYTAATKPTVAYDDADGLDSRIPDITTLAADDILSFDLDSVATGAVGLDVVLVLSVPSGASSSLTVEEEDGSPSVGSVTEIKFPNGSVTNNGSGSVSVVTGAGATKYIFKDLVVAADSDLGDFRGWSSGTGSTVRNVNFYVPGDFASLTGIWVVIIPTADSTTQNFDLTSDYGAVGEAYTTHSESDNTGALTLTNTQIYRVDVSGVFSSLAAGDFCGLEITKKVNQGLIFIGLLMEYVTT